MRGAASPGADVGGGGGGERTAVTVGNFDGVHRGHAAILAACRARVGAEGRVVAVTFEPTPVEVLRPAAAPPRLMSADGRVAALRAAGADAVEVLEPGPDLLGLSAEAFVEMVLATHRPSAWVEGPDFRFGKGRAGDMERLAALGAKRGFVAVTVPRVTATLGDQTVAPVSSSLVRWLVGRGRVADAAATLGRPFALTGDVVRGEQRGRTIGVPTANVALGDAARVALPADGVYAAWASVAGDDARWPAAVSVGVKPTFGKVGLTVEAHLIGFAGDLYGRSLTLKFTRWVRGQYAFGGVEALTAQLGRDIATVRRWAG